MPTKYILAGGRVYNAPDGGRAFCEELIKGFSEPVKILECLFAEHEELWTEKFTKDKIFFETNLPGKKFVLELASIDKFTEQVMWADAIYLRGGETNRLIKGLTKDTNWLNYLDGKTLAGTSAGADAIAKYYYGLDDLILADGLGLVPVKTIVHYRSDYNAPNIDWDKAEKELENYKEPLEIIALAEGEFKVL